MIAELSDEQVLAERLVHHPMLIANPSGPVTGQGVTQRLGLAHAFKRQETVAALPGYVAYYWERN